MSNAMRFGKRTLAGVAAGALALGALTIASAPAVSAKPSVTPKAVVSPATGPVRVSFTGTTLDSVPYSDLYWTVSQAVVGTETVTVTLTAAPTPLAQIGIAPYGTIGTATAYSGTRFTNATDTVVLGTPATIAVGVPTPATEPAIAIAANTAGTYAGTISFTDASDNRVDTGTFSFTTTGKPTSMTLTPASSTTVVSGTTDLTVTLKDSGGNVTQPLAADTVTLTPGSVMTASGQTTAITMSDLYNGEADTTYTAPATAGSYTVTATPGGTLPSGGVTAQSATVVVSGTIAPGLLTGASVTVPASAVAGGTAPTAITSGVPAGTSKVTVRVTGGTANGLARLAFFRTANQTGSIDGVAVGTSIATAVFKDITLGSTGAGSVDITIGGNLLIGTTPGSGTPGQVVVQQANATNGQQGTLQLTITQQLPTVLPASILTAPTGSIVQALGTATPVTITVLDQFLNPIANAAVQARRGTTTLLSEGITNASGQATLNVSGATGIAAGTTETYNFYATPTGGAQVGPAATPLTILYTASGAVTSMSVSVAGGATTPILNTSTSIPTRPYIQVPFGGVVSTAATGVYTVATGAGTAAGNFVTFAASPSPANTVTVTVPEGVKVSTTLPSATTLWSAGAQTVSAASGQNVYVWATKTGTHDITFKSGAITTTAKIEVDTPPAAAYNIAVSPSSRTIESGAFSTVELTVSDVFGNPIPGITNVAGAAGAVAATASGEVLLSGLNANATLGTGATGKTTVTLVAGKSGTGKVTFAPSGGVTNAAAAWQTGYVKPVGAPDPVKAAEVAVIVTAKEQRTITVTDSGRTTVSGKPGVYADGDTDGFAEGDKLAVMVRFPGQTSYEKGSATPAVDKSGAFSWERKTGKKTYVYFTSADGVISSNTVIIPAK